MPHCRVWVCVRDALAGHVSLGERLARACVPCIACPLYPYLHFDVPASTFAVRLIHGSVRGSDTDWRTCPTWSPFTLQDTIATVGRENGVGLDELSRPVPIQRAAQVRRILVHADPNQTQYHTNDCRRERKRVASRLSLFCAHLSLT